MTGCDSVLKLHAALEGEGEAVSPSQVKKAASKATKRTSRVPEAGRSTTAATRVDVTGAEASPEVSAGLAMPKTAEPEVRISPNPSCHSPL